MVHMHLFWYSFAYQSPTVHGIRLIHDFTLQDDFLKDYADFSTQYLRRIERFMYVIATSTYPLFIRKTITKDQALDLRNFLLILRNGRPFLLLTLGNTEEMRHDWNLEMVHNYYLRQPEPYSWKGDPDAWKEIFHALGLLPLSTLG
jgi:hypothetical protein